ncbi:hypothetical protein P152DRAFT_419426 [Eremomyces bilateralis CBS 781.70]|uniref:BZIP domain-containing protein n=1 Tax=Eremomyces bilateralis CBS 781.70 TaxID=1392243 RepID=A0A6G1FZP7_9PEZI|nr:uncharacterized protein P152DRAFT_419426 [Eremomyces bilateralis CBS 781.70]KAF1811327.1 hypothetical protein P152DRAFT_419426 [Eremomyces bilateralis CBS 781.70]
MANYDNSDTGNSKGPLEMFGFLKNLTGDKKTTRDGQTPKRRGPKPDSKPALTRRQELNRQAQRTHRERKEMYIKALEQEVLRLKDLFAQTVHERDNFAEENRRLKEVLAAHGIHYDINSPSLSINRQNSSYGDASSAGSVHSYGPNTESTRFTSPPNISPGNMPPGRAPPPVPTMAPGQQGVDYDQIGIDFVLTLERPCMDHMQFLMVRSQDSEGEISGHVLMATCPPESHVAHSPDDQYPHKMPDMSMPELVKLLDLSNRLPLDGEITPIMAWVTIRKHPRVLEMGKEDFENIKEALTAKVRCYGFGAVLEELDVREALAEIFEQKDG